MAMGAGTELKRLLSRIGIQACSSCDGRAVIMDEEGLQWCRENAGLIVNWLRQAAEEKGLPFLEVGARALVRLAIWRAERKLKMLERQL